MSDPHPEPGPALLRSLLERQLPNQSWLGAPLEIRPLPRKSRQRLVGYLLAVAQLLALDEPAADALLAAYGQSPLVRLRLRGDRLLDPLLAHWPAPDAPSIAPADLPPEDPAPLPELVRQALELLGVVIAPSDLPPPPDARSSGLLRAFRQAFEVRGQTERGLRARQARYYIDLVERAQTRYLEGGGVAEGLAVFDQERPNLDVARVWLHEQTVQAPDANGDALLIDDGYATVYLGSMRYVGSERIGQFHAALAAAYRQSDRRAQAAALGNLALAYEATGEVHRAISYQEQCLIIARELHNREGEAAALGNLATAYEMVGELRRSIAFYEQSLAIGQEIGDRRGEARALGRLGSVYLTLGEPRRALYLQDQSLKIAREIGDPLGEATALAGIGNVWFALSDYHQAIAYFEQYLMSARSFRDRSGELVALVNIGSAYSALSHVQRAISYYEQGMIIAREIGDLNKEDAILGHLGDCYLAIGEHHSAISYYEQCRAMARQIRLRPNEAYALGKLGNVSMALSEVPKALSLYEQSLALMREVSDRKGEGSILSNLGTAYLRLGETDSAVLCYEQSLKIAREVGNRNSEAIALGDLGHVYQMIGDWGRAAVLYEQWRLIAQEIGDRRSEGAALGFLGTVFKDRGRVDRAISYYEQHLTIVREIGDRQGECNVLGNLANAYQSQGELRRATTLYEQSLTIARSIGDRRGEGKTLSNLGLLSLACGEPQRALALFEQSMVIVRAIGDRRAEGSILGQFGSAYLDLGEARRSIDYFEQHLAIARSVGDLRGEGEALGDLGQAYYLLGQPRRAIDYYEQQLAIAQKLGDRYVEGTALCNKGIAYADLGETRRAIGLYEQSQTIAQEIGDRQGVASADWNLGLALVNTGDPRRGLDHLEQGLAFYQQIGHPRTEKMSSAVLYVRKHGTLPSTSPPQAALDAMPPEVRAAVERRDTAALIEALAALPLQDVQVLNAGLEELIGAGGPAMADVVRHFQPLLRAIAAFARDNKGPRKAIEDVLAELEQEGYELLRPVRLIWSGERDRATLTKELDPMEAALIGHILELVDSPEQADAQSDLQPRFAELVRDIVRVALGEAKLRVQVEAALAEGEEHGWMLQAPVARIWAGERDLAALAAGLDRQDTALIAQVLELIAEYERDGRQPRAQLEAALPEAVRVALDQLDRAAFDAALAALPPAERERADQIIAQLTAEMQLDSSSQRAGAAQLGDTPAGLDMAAILQRFHLLFVYIAQAAHGDADARALAEAALPLMEQSGWRIAEAARRTWSGERRLGVLTAQIDANSALMVRRILELVESSPPSAARRSGAGARKSSEGSTSSPSEDVLELVGLIQSLPEPVRLAFEQQNIVDLRAAIAVLSPAERTRVEHILDEMTRKVAIINQAQSPSAQAAAPAAPDPNDMVQRFLPLLGDIALAVYGDVDARALAEAVLELMEHDGWDITEAVHRIWSGERDAGVLTRGLAVHESALVLRALALVADGPRMIFAAQSLQIAHARRQADEAAAQALRNDDFAARVALAKQFVEASQQARRGVGAPWKALATHLRELSQQLEQGGSAHRVARTGHTKNYTKDAKDLTM